MVVLAMAMNRVVTLVVSAPHRPPHSTRHPRSRCVSSHTRSSAIVKEN